MDNLDYNIASNRLYKFFWNTFCDEWIEISKKRSISLTLDKIIKDFKPIFNIWFS